MANVISSTCSANKHFLHTGFSNTVSSSYTTPGAGPRGITWDGTNVLSTDVAARKHYKHAGFSDTIDSSYSTVEVTVTGITWDGTNVIGVDTSTPKHCLHAGFSSSITESYTSPSTDPHGITWDFTNVLSVDIDSDKQYRHIGFSSSIESSHSCPGNLSKGISWDGANVISTDLATTKHYKHIGFSTSIESSYFAPGGVKLGITWDDRYASVQYQQTVLGTLTFVGIITSANKWILTLVGELTFAGALEHATRWLHVVSGSLTLTGVANRRTTKTFTGTLSLAGSLLRSFGFLAKEGVLTLAGTLSRSVRKVLTSTLVPNGFFVPFARRILSGALATRRRDVLKIINDDPWIVTIYRTGRTPDDAETSFSFVGRIQPVGARGAPREERPRATALQGELPVGYYGWALLAPYDTPKMLTRDTVKATQQSSGIVRTFRVAYSGQYAYKHEVIMDERE